MNSNAKPIDELRRSTDIEELTQERQARIRMLGTLDGTYWANVVRSEIAQINARIARLPITGKCGHPDGCTGDCLPDEGENVGW